MAYYSGMQPTNRKERTLLFVRLTTPRSIDTSRLWVYSVSLCGIVAQMCVFVKHKKAYRRGDKPFCH